jgi:hypothetical protein
VGVAEYVGFVNRKVVEYARRQGGQHGHSEGEAGAGTLTNTRSIEGDYAPPWEGVDERLPTLYGTGQPIYQKKGWSGTGVGGAYEGHTWQWVMKQGFLHGSYC